MRQKSVAMLNRQIENRIAKLGQSSPFIVGSLVLSRRRCGSKSCECANGGPLHDAYILTKNSGGKTKSIYVPVDMVKEVGKWTREYKRIKELIKEIDELSEVVIAVSKQRKKAIIKSTREEK